MGQKKVSKLAQDIFILVNRYQNLNIGLIGFTWIQGHSKIEGNNIVNVARDLHFTRFIGCAYEDLKKLMAHDLNQIGNNLLVIFPGFPEL